jgi:hypothetical protein
MMAIKPQFIVIALLSLPISSFGAIVNNNHLFKKSEQIIAQLQAIREFQQLAAIQPEPGVVANKIPMSLLYKTIQLNEKTVELQQKLGLSPDRPVNAELKVIRPRDVMPYLDELELRLDSVEQALGISLAQAPIDRPLGKSANDVYRQLLVIESLFDGLVAPQSWSAVSRDLEWILIDLKQIAQKEGLSFEVREPDAMQGYEATDVNLVAFQNLHLLGRLLRQLNFDAFPPGSLPVGLVETHQVADCILMLRSELDRLSFTLGLDRVPEPATIPLLADANAAYGAMIALRGGLLMMAEDKH